ncbi:hypothetical protein SCALM49S_07587 [Streptomyces californicus]
MTRDFNDYAPRRIGDANDLVLARKRNADERIYMVTTNLVIDAQEKRPGRVHRPNGGGHPVPTGPARHPHHHTSLDQHLRFPIGKDTATIEEALLDGGRELSLFPSETSSPGSPRVSGVC